MKQFPIFLSVVIGVRNQAPQLASLLAEMSEAIEPLVDDYELIVVENGSSDGSVAALAALTSADGLANLQVYALTKEVDSDTLAWVGLENALGDFVAVIDPLFDDIRFLPTMLERATTGSDIVFASNDSKQLESLPYLISRAAFNAFYKSLHGVHLAKEGSQYRLLSKRVVNFILQHPLPALTYRRLPATGGFKRSKLSYSSPPRSVQRKRLSVGIDQSLRLLVSTSRLPMRLFTGSLVAYSFASLLASIFMAIRTFSTPNADRALPLAMLQTNSLFFVGALVQSMFGEYILQMTSVSSEGPPYHVAEELTSATITRRARLNVESSRPAGALR